MRPQKKNPAVQKALIKKWLETTDAVTDDNRKVLLNKIDTIGEKELDSLFEFYLENEELEKMEQGKEPAIEMRQPEEDLPIHPNASMKVRKESSLSVKNDYKSPSESIREKSMLLKSENRPKESVLSKFMPLIVVLVISALVIAFFAFGPRSEKERLKDAFVEMMCDDTIIDFMIDSSENPYDPDVQKQAMELESHMMEIFEKHGFEDEYEIQEAMMNMVEDDIGAFIEMGKEVEEKCGEKYEDLEGMNSNPFMNF